MKLLKFLTVITVSTVESLARAGIPSYLRHHECIRDVNDSRYDGDAPCINDVILRAERRMDGQCIKDMNDSRYNEYDICHTEGPIDVPTYRWQGRREKFKNLQEGEHDPNDSRYAGDIKGDYVRDPNDSRYLAVDESGGFAEDDLNAVDAAGDIITAPADPTRDRHNDYDYNGHPIPEALGWH